MNQRFLELRRHWRNVCITTVVYGQTYAVLLMFAVGVGLLSGGLISLSTAQITAPQPADANFATGAPAAFNYFPFRGITQAPQGALAVDPEVGVPDRAIGGEEAIPAEPENLDGPYDDTLQRNAVGNLFKYIEGSFGALIMTAAGIGAIVAASMGAYKAAIGILVVAIGAFILRAFVSLFFGTDYNEFGGLVGPSGGPVGGL
jgi:hypothetical protein